MYQVFELPHDFLDRDYTEQEKATFDSKLWDAIHGPELTEELDDKQKKKVDRWSDWQDAAVKREHNRVFGPGIDRIILPYDSSKDQKITTANFRTSELMRNVGSVHHATVLSHLQEAGYHTDDYASGLVYHQEKPERKIKINKAMNLAGIAEKEMHNHRVLGNDNDDGTFTPGRALKLREVYDSDPVRAALKSEKQIVITRNKYDVAGMSTNRGWSSCMNMVDGCNKHYLPKDIQHGTLTAYLTHKGDDGVTKPIGRINLKRFDSTDHTIFRPEKNQYGTTPHGFKNAVKDWAEKNYESKPGAYIKHAALYNDDGNTVRMEKIDHIPSSDISKSAENAARGILRDTFENPPKEANDWMDGDDDTKNNAYTAVHNIMGHLNDKDFAKEVTHHVVDHAYDHDGDDQEVDRTKFYNESSHELHSSDVMHHWGIQQIASTIGSAKYIRGLEHFNDDELHAHVEKLHKGMHGSEDADHVTLKELYAGAVDEAFSRDAPHIHSTILHHMTDSKNQDFHSDLMQSHHTIMDQKHPLELTHDPRMMHHVFNSDTSHFTVSDAWNHDTMKHVGTYADHKLAHDVMHHIDVNDDSRRGLVKGLNENPNGEKIQHHLIDDMLLTGGQYHGSGMVRDIASKSDLANALRGNHHGFPRIHGFNPEQTDHEVDYVEKFADIANYTKFPSVYNRIKKRAEPGGDLDHESIKDGIKYNTTLKEQFEIDTNDKRRFRDFMKIIG